MPIFAAMSCLATAIRTGSGKGVELTTGDDVFVGRPKNLVTTTAGGRYEN